KRMPDSLQVPYTNLRNALGEVTPRPILTVAIMYASRSVEAAGLVDSGADISVMPYGLGTALGLSWDEQRYSLRLSGNMANYDTCAVVLSVKVADFPAADLAFAWTQAEHAPLIFGQTNFFSTFNVCFYRADTYFMLAIKTPPLPGG